MARMSASFTAAVDKALDVLTTDVGDRFGLDMRETSEWSGAVQRIHADLGGLHVPR